MRLPQACLQSFTEMLADICVDNAKVLRTPKADLIGPANH
jgi:hypothetical protein